MDPITLALIGMAVGTLAQGGAGIGKSIQADKERKKYQQYEDELAKTKKKENYKNAIGRAMGMSNPFMVDEKQAPQPGSTKGWDILGGVGQGVGALSQLGYQGMSPRQQSMAAATGF